MHGAEDEIFCNYSKSPSNEPGSLHSPCEGAGRWEWQALALGTLPRLSVMIKDTSVPNEPSSHIQVGAINHRPHKLRAMFAEKTKEP